MRSLFTLHEGEFLVGDHINRKLGHKYDMWLPCRDRGSDLLVTGKRRRGKAVGLQVRFSRGSGIREEMARHLIATSWLTSEFAKLRERQAGIWVFVILNLKHEEHFVVVPTQVLRKRIPRGRGTTWYLWLFGDGWCYQVHDLGREEKLDTLRRGVRDPHRDFTEWLEHWKLPGRVARNAR